MKKIFYIIFVLLISVGLASCSKDKDPVDLTVDVVSETVVSNHIEVHVVVPIELSSMAELYEIALSISSQTYEKYFDTIETNRYMLTIVLYQSSAEFTSNTPSYGQITFVINDSISTPGLQIDQNDLIFE